MKNKLLVTGCWLLVTGFAIFSYSQVDLNLTLSKTPLYLAFQKQMTSLGYYNRPLSTIIFIVLSMLLAACCLLLAANTYLKRLRLKSLKWPLLVIALILLIGYPLFSHDIFNYIFNAKMVWLYKQNPHKQVAAYFVHDVWLRFMHNVHTPAPYAYGWTMLSLIPGILTLTQSLKLSLWGMKAFIALFWAGQLWILSKIIKENFPNSIHNCPAQKGNWRWFLFTLNPLVLIETLVVGHNDVVMMFLALTSYYFLLKTKRLFDKNLLFSLLFLGLSVSIKYATIVLLPLWLIRLSIKTPGVDKKTPGVNLLDIPSLAAILLFAIIFTRPDQLHSWYLIWAFSFAVLSKSKWIISLFTALTIGALLRYTPYLYFGHWDPPVYMLRNIIWVLSALLTFPILSVVKKIPRGA